MIMRSLEYTLCPDNPPALEVSALNRLPFQIPAEISEHDSVLPRYH